MLDRLDTVCREEPSGFLAVTSGGRMIENDRIGRAPPQYALKESQLPLLHRQTCLPPVRQAGLVLGDVGVSQLSQLICCDT